MNTGENDDTNELDTSGFSGIDVDDDNYNDNYHDDIEPAKPNIDLGLVKQELPDFTSEAVGSENLLPNEVAFPKAEWIPEGVETEEPGCLADSVEQTNTEIHSGQTGDYVDTPDNLSDFTHSVTDFVAPNTPVLKKRRQSPQGSKRKAKHTQSEDGEGKKVKDNIYLTSTL